MLTSLESVRDHEGFYSIEVGRGVIGQVRYKMRLASRAESGTNILNVYKVLVLKTEGKRRYMRHI